MSMPLMYFKPYAPGRVILASRTSDWHSSYSIGILHSVLSIDSIAIIIAQTPTSEIKYCKIKCLLDLQFEISRVEIHSSLFDQVLYPLLMFAMKSLLTTIIKVYIVLIYSKAGIRILP